MTAISQSSVASMTGYASITGAHDGIRWTLEARSVNGRGLDIKMRLPTGWDALDPIIKDQFRERLLRGNVSVSVQIESEQTGDGLSLNHAFLTQLTQLAKQAEAITGQPVNLADVFAMRGVLEETSGAEAVEAHQNAALPLIAADIERLADALQAARAREGASMLAVLQEHATMLETLTGEAAAMAANIPVLLRERLQTTIAALRQDSEMEFPEERLAQEIMVLATKADIREEIDRLKAHIENLRDLLDEGRGIGRRLDFLAQEFNREANTLCSKSSSTELTRVGMALKTVIDQLREQVQNIE